MLHILGLDAAGKTTLLYRIKLGEVIDAAPSIGKVVALNDYCVFTKKTRNFGILTVWRYKGDTWDLQSPTTEY